MLCTFTEAYKCLGFKSRASIYQLRDKGILEPYIRRINDQKYLFMGAIKGVTLAKHIQNNLTSNNWIPINDYDLEKYILHLHKRLNKNGILVLGLPNCNSYDAKYYKENWAAWDLPIHLYHFTKKDIKKIADKYGFKVIKTKPLLFDSFYISMLSEQKKGKSKLFGLWLGLVSNLKAKKHKEYSSHIYILRKQAV